MRLTSMGTRGAMVVIGILLAACGRDASAPPPDLPAGPLATDRLEYSCGGGDVFTPADIAREEAPPREILDAIHELRQTIDGEMLPEKGWIEVSGSNQRSTVIAPLRDHYAEATFEREGNGWKPAGWGDCLPRLHLEGRSVLRWAFTDESFPPDPSSRELSIAATEVQCSSGRDIEGLIEQHVTYHPSRIEVALTAPGLEAGKNEAFTCIGTSPVDYQLVLEEPVGDRPVVDVSVYPSVEPTPGTPLP